MVPSIPGAYLFLIQFSPPRQLRRNPQNVTTPAAAITEIGEEQMLNSNRSINYMLSHYLVSNTTEVLLLTMPTLDILLNLPLTTEVTLLVVHTVLSDTLLDMAVPTTW